MDIDKLHRAAQKPALYEKGDSVMWTDEHISRQLLKLHLDPEVDSASRSRLSIERTMDFILSFFDKNPMSVLDLGCGPGIYMEKLAALGHACTGIDFSRNSIDYARMQAEEKGLDIRYIHQNYLEMDHREQFDLVILIYTDIGVLLPEERVHLLDRIHRALKPGGIFIFDVLNERNLDQKFQETQVLSHQSGGFWKSTPYMELACGYHYPEHKVFLKQHSILDEEDQIRTYRFWTHYFSREDVIHLLSARGFAGIEHSDRVLPANDIWDGKNISFYKSQK